MSSTPIAELLAGLPGTLEALLSHPERHRPEVVEALLERTDALRRGDPEQALALADAAQHLAARIPPFFPRDERFRLRARSFEVWAGLQRDLGDGVAADGGLLAALELLTQVEGVDAEQMASHLGRHALLAGDRRDVEGLFRYVEAGLEVARDADGEHAFRTVRSLLEGVMAEEHAVLPAMWTTLAIVANVSAVPEGGGPETVGRVTTEAFLSDEAIEVFLRREAPARGGLPWKISAQIRLFSADEAEILLVRQVPSKDDPDAWAVDESVGWRLFSTVAAAEADG